MVYLDNIFVFSKSQVVNVQHLCKVLELLKFEELCVKLSERSLTYIDFLGIETV